MSDGQPKKPNRPTHVSNYAEACLQALATSGLGDKLSLERIAQHRPLTRIADPADRAVIERSRTWFVTEFLNALQD